MKLLCLRLKNINSFKGNVELDFEQPPLSETNLFAITGPTGAGKSTLLDAICVALYNRTPRLSSRGTSSPYHLLRQGETEGSCEVVFEASGHRYQAVWQIRRSRSGAYRPTARLLDADKEVTITERLAAKQGAKDDADLSVGEVVEQILGLDFPGFTRSILLAQGDFAAFLQADMEQKRNILEATTGFEIYDQLKKVLNEQHALVKRSHDEAQRLLEAIPQVNEEQLTELGAQLSQHNEQLGKCQSEYIQTEAAREVEARRTDIHQELTQAEEQVCALDAQSDEMERLAAETAEARRASELRSEREAFGSSKQRLEHAESQITEFRKAVQEAEQSYQQSGVRFNQVQDQYRQVQEGSEQERGTIQQARDEENRAQIESEEADSLSKQMKQTKAEIRKAKKTLTATRKELTQLAESVADDEAYLEKNQLPSDHAQRVAHANRLQVTLESQQQEETTRKKELEVLEKRIAFIRDEVESDTETQSQLAHQRDQSQSQVAEAQSQLEALLRDGDEEAREDQRVAAQRALELGGKHEPLVRQLTDLRKQQSELEAQLEKSQTQIAQSTSKLDQMQVDLAEAEAAVEHYQAMQEKAQLSDQILLLRSKHLETGEPCPVCGSREHPLKEHTEAIPTVADELSAARKHLTKTQRAYQKSMTQLAATQASHKGQEKALQDVQSRCEVIESEATELEQQWHVIYPEDDISTAFARTQQQTAEKALKHLSQLRQSVSELQNQRQLVSQQLEHLVQKQERQTQSLEQAVSDCKQLETQIGQRTREIAETQERFWEQLPTEFHGRAVARGLQRFEKWVAEVQARQAQAVKNAHERTLLEQQVSAQDDQLRAQDDRIAQLTEEEKKHRSRAETFRQSAQERTGGLSSGDAQKALQAKLKQAEEARESAIEVQQVAQRQLAARSGEYDQAREQRDTRQREWEAAQSRYLQALVDEGFDSADAHAAAMREPDWVRQQESVLASYRQKKHTLQETVQRLQRTFAEKPFEPGLLQQLSRRLHELNAEIGAIQSTQGQLRERLAQLTEERQRYQEQFKHYERSREEYERWDELRNCIPDNRLRDFALESMFGLLAQLANRQLQVLSDRYQLEVVGIKEMWVVDRWNAGERRPVETLSGGESFLTSLALALALSELSRGRARLQSLFLDEGFGTLDRETLDVALAALEGLRLSGRMVGVISHIEELTQRIPVRVCVQRLGNGASGIQVEG